MSSLSSVKFLGGVEQHSNLAEVDSVIEEILTAKAPRGKRPLAQEIDKGIAPKNLDDESFISTDESSADDSKPHVLCSMPYTNENKMGAIVAALEFARRYKGEAPPPPPPATSAEQNRPKPTYSLIAEEGVFETELAQRDHLNSINSFRKNLMSQIARVDSELEAINDAEDEKGDSDDDFQELQALTFLHQG